MSSTYIIKQGDYLALLAQRNGFADYHTIWDAPENSALKALRVNPNILYPGDSLFIPDREIREEERPTEQRHKFQKDEQDLKLRIVLTDLKDKPLAGLECSLTIDGNPKDFTTGADGKLSEDISPKATGGKLVDKGKPGPGYRLQREFPVKIGNLDPPEKLSGQIARLNNLGYRAFDLPDHPLSPAEEEAIGKDPQFLSAVEEFQCDESPNPPQGVDGICGAATQAKLQKVHGC